MTSLFYRPGHEEMTRIRERTTRMAKREARFSGSRVYSCVRGHVTHVIVHWLPSGLGAAISRPGP